MKKRLAVIGYGGMGNWHCAHAMNSDVVELAGIYDIKEEKRNLARSRGVRVYETLEEVLSDPTVDILTLAVPNDCHKELAVRGLGAGKNVISEKPVTLCSADLEEMIAASEKAGKLFSVHQNRRFDTDYLAVRSIFESGEIGNVFCIESRVHGSRGIPGDWRKEKEHGGGMILDWGVHLIDQALQMVPYPVTSVYATLDHITNSEVDDGCKIDIFFENGTLYRVEVGTCNFINLPRFYLLGTDGSALIRDWPSPVEVARVKTWENSDAVPVRTAAGITKTMAPRTAETTESYTVPQPSADVHDYYRNFCAAIDGITTQLVTHPEMRRVMKVMEAAFASGESHEVVKTLI